MPQRAETSSIPPAIGDPSPAWPLVHPDRIITGDLGACRPFRDPQCPRWHVGEDLPAPRGTIVIAPEGGELVAVHPDFHEGTGIMLLQTDTGPMLGLGEVEPHSWREFAVDAGSRVLKGQAVARVGRLKMLHFEAYREGTTRTSSWKRGQPPPASVLDPTDYLELAAGWPVRPVAPPVLPPVRPPIFTPPATTIAGGGAALLALLAAAWLFSRGRKGLF